MPEPLPQAPPDVFTAQIVQQVVPALCRSSELETKNTRASAEEEPVEHLLQTSAGQIFGCTRPRTENGRSCKLGFGPPPGLRPRPMAVQEQHFP